MKNKSTFLISLLTSILFFSLSAFSQTTVFTYQGKLSDTGSPPTGTYQMEFRLFDAVSGGAPIGSLITNNAVSVTQGVFTVNLNFGAPAFPGADRFLEISVRRNAGEAFVTLNPRQQIASSPYSIRTLSAAQADNSAQLGGVAASQYLQTNGSGSGLTNLNAGSITTGTLNNARLGQIPTANIADSAVTAAKIAAGQVVKSVNGLQDNVTLAAGTNISITPSGNTLTIASTGGNPILNQTTQQAGANFNIGGTGTANIFNAGTQFSIGANRVLSIGGTHNLFAGVNAGAANTGESNTFIGRDAGPVNTTGNFNSFVGALAGFTNTTGIQNSFIGAATGANNTTGSFNLFVGTFAGNANTTGGGNSFFGRNAGLLNTTGSFNSFAGTNAGQNNTTGQSNSFFGNSAGFSNTTGGNNSFFGTNAGAFNTTGVGNSFVGTFAGNANTTGSGNSFVGTAAGLSNTTVGDNSFVGSAAGHNNTTGGSNSFFGTSAGRNNAAGTNNSFVGTSAGENNTASSNSFVGAFAGLFNTTGGSNLFIGASAGRSNTTGGSNAFVGASVGFNNTTGGGNSFVGVNAGQSNTTGGLNSFVGNGSGFSNTTGSDNSFFGRNAGNANTTGSNNTAIGQAANVASGALTFATAIGSGATVSDSSSVVLGRTADTVRIPGNLVVVGTLTATINGSTITNLNASNITTGTLPNARLGVVPIANGGTGSSSQNFVDLTTTQTVAGAKTFSNAVNTAAQYNIGGSRVLSAGGSNNLFAGVGAGGANPTGNFNSFFGRDAGFSNTGEGNSFIGSSAGFTSTGNNNSFVGRDAGYFNTGGGDNSFMGTSAGFFNASGSSNSFFGRGAGSNNVSGSNNTAIGQGADVAADNLSFATAIGSGAVVTGSNRVQIGRAADTVNVPGTLTKAAGAFEIDHPLDPQNKTLSHSFVESSDMMNVYNGNITTDGRGEATVVLPDYFEALNRDFRYQLTVIGTFAQAIIAEKVKGNSLKIRTSLPNVEVSWQVTGIRQDKFANDQRIPNSKDKPSSEKGTCLYAPACGEGANGKTSIKPK